MGIFNALYHAEESERVTLAGVVRPSDVEGLAGNEFVAYFHTTGALVRCDRDTELPLALPELGWEIVTFAPVQDGFAPVGLGNMLNGGGAIIAQGPAPRGGCTIRLRDGGHFVTWCVASPEALEVDGADVAFAYDPGTGTLSADVPASGACELRLL